tara:strand:- start:50 stop:223 length:174 start_codon:yes stop_codon:yes gene_type:complete
MPTASDGKEFPYTKAGLEAHMVYEGLLKRKNYKMRRSPKHPMNTERTTSNPSGKYST